MATIYVANVKPTSLSARLAALLLEHGFVTEHFVAARRRTWDDDAWCAYSKTGVIASTSSMKDCVEHGITEPYGNEVKSLNDADAYLNATGQNWPH